MPSYRVKLRRGTTLDHVSFVGAEGELTVNTDLKRIVVHDGVTPGGHMLAAEADIKTDINEFTDTEGKLTNFTYTPAGTTIDTTVAIPVVNFSVKVATGHRRIPPFRGRGNVFAFRNDTLSQTGFYNNPILQLVPGTKYIFDVSDSSNSGHPLRFTATRGNSGYTTGLVVTGTPGTAGATVNFTVPTPPPFPLWYMCSVHGTGMGNRIRY